MFKNADEAVSELLRRIQIQEKSGKEIRLCEYVEHAPSTMSMSDYAGPLFKACSLRLRQQALIWECDMRPHWQLAGCACSGSLKPTSVIYRLP